MASGLERNWHLTNRRYMKIFSLIATGGSILLIGGMALAMPDVVLHASIRGVKIWWDVLFPALFPFFVMSELMLGFGVVHLAGQLLDPFMRPLFRLPGAGGFVLAIGFASGYPVGAKMTSKLMEQNLVTRTQGERLVEMTTTADPIFLIGAVSLGFFGRPDVAVILACAHYGGALLLGLWSRWRQEDAREALPEPTRLGFAGRIKSALTAMHQARLADGRPPSLLLQASIRHSLSLVIIVGGLVVFFCAALELLLMSGILGLIQNAIARMIQLFGWPAQLAPSIVRGAFEVTLGAQAAAQTPPQSGAISLADQMAAAAFVLSWAGLSVHAQVAGLMSKTGWRYMPFAKSRLLHAIAASLLVYVLWPIFPLENSSPTFVPLIAVPEHAIQFATWPVLIFGGTLVFLIATGTTASIIQQLRK